MLNYTGSNYKKIYRYCNKPKLFCFCDGTNKAAPKTEFI
jgi:hypothetical protein